MKQETHIVRPLGKYGHTYLLKSGAYFLYRIFGATLYILISTMFLLEFIYPKFYLTILNWSPNTPILLSFVISILGIFVMLKIASYGEISRSDVSVGASDSPSQPFFVNFHKAFGLFCGAALTIVSGAAVIVQLVIEHRVRGDLLGIFFVFAFLFYLMIKKSRYMRR